MKSTYSSVEFVYIDETDGTVLKVPSKLYLILTFDIYNILFYIILYYHPTETSKTIIM
jgi:hypothetical protein